VDSAATCTDESCKQCDNNSRCGDAAAQPPAFSKLTETVLHPKTVVARGVLEHECSILLKEFFQKKRKSKVIIF
jgi:hypothetical protein